VVLGRAAAAVGHEMSDLVATLKRSVREEEGRQCTQVDRDFHEELRQLERSADLLSSFAPREDVPRFARTSMRSSATASIATGIPHSGGCDLVGDRR